MPALFVMASRFAGHPAWRGWAAYTRAIALITIGCILVYCVALADSVTSSARAPS